MSVLDDRYRDTGNGIAVEYGGDLLPNLFGCLGVIPERTVFVFSVHPLALLILPPLPEGNPR